MKDSKAIFICLILPLFLIAGCVSAANHQKDLPVQTEKEMTVGTAQAEIKKGMSQADVLEVLGSPNIVTKDSDGKETWAYDKMSREVYYSKSQAGAYGTVLIVGGSYSKEAGAIRTSQKTLTIIIKFDKNHMVDTFSYHSSRF
jgi:outer membrane protein assembly factor BamE (lipoprotein component of BamABCDE complex)